MNEELLMSGAIASPNIKEAVGEAIMLQKEEIFQKVTDFFPKLL